MTKPNLTQDLKLPVNSTTPVLIQKIATRAFKAVQRVAFGQASEKEKVRKRESEKVRRKIRVLTEYPGTLIVGHDEDNIWLCHFFPLRILTLVPMKDDRIVG